MQEETTSQTGSLETPKDAGLGPSGVVKRWLMELDLADKTEAGWRKNALDALERYRDEKANSTNAVKSYSSSNRFNILYSNVQTICPALYNQTPKPDVRRRFRDQDPVGKQISTVVERALSYTMDAQDLDRYMRFAVKDSQIQGRGVTRIMYEPTFGTGYGEETYNEETGGYEREEFEELKFEEVVFEHVPWQDFRRGPGNIWEDVPWIAFKHTLTRDQLLELGPRGKDVELDYSPDGIDAEDESEVADTFKRGVVWEIWCKDTGMVYFIAPSLKDGPVKVDDDPLGLEGFFPIPRPLYATEDTTTLVPAEPFRFYRDQAAELDEITKRISGIIKACKARGVYDATLQEMGDLMNIGENILVPSENVLTLLNQPGGLQNAIWMFPIEKIAGVLIHLYNQRDAIKQTIYEITGIADIMRGSSAASETLGAQQLKAQFGTMRLDDMKREVQRYARDIVRITAEIMAEKFNPTTLQIMTGQEITPEMIAVMQNDGPRSFRIDIETDSTVAGDLMTEQKNMTEMLGGIAQFLQAIGPAVDTGYIPADAAKSMLTGAIRRFKMGREVEDALEQIGAQEGQQGQPQQDQAAMQQQAQMQAEQQAQAQEQAKFQAEMQLEQVKLQKDQEIEAMKANNDMLLAREKMQNDMQQAQAELDMKERVERYKAELQAGVSREANVLSAQTQRNEVM